MATFNGEPIISSVPNVDGEETVALLYNPEQLQMYPHWKPLLAMVNQTFKVSHKAYWPKDVYDRFSDAQSFIDELEPEFFTIILSSKNVNRDGHPRIYATASARTLVKHASSSQELSAGFRGEVKHIPGKTEAWELKILAVDTSLYRRGLGSVLQVLVEEEIKKRVRLAISQQGEAVKQVEGSVGILYTLTTVAGVNEDYYVKKGYKTMKLTLLEKMALSNVKECHIAHMEKVIQL